MLCDLCGGVTEYVPGAEGCRCPYSPRISSLVAVTGPAVRRPVGNAARAAARDRHRGAPRWSVPGARPRPRPLFCPRGARPAPTPIVRELGGEVRPGALVPFTVDRSRALKALDDWADARRGSRPVAGEAVGLPRPSRPRSSPPGCSTSRDGEPLRGAARRPLLPGRDLRERRRDQDPIGPAHPLAARERHGRPPVHRTSSVPATKRRTGR